MVCGNDSYKEILPNQFRITKKVGEYYTGKSIQKTSEEHEIKKNTVQKPLKVLENIVRLSAE